MPITRTDPIESSYFPCGFVLSRTAREQLDLDALPDRRRGPADARSAETAQAIADKINRRKDFSVSDRPPARAGELLSLALLTEVLRELINYYCADVNGGAMGRGLQFARSGGGADMAERPLRCFLDYYPPEEVIRGETTPQAFLESRSGALSHREVLARELVLLWFTVENPAVTQYRVLYDDDQFRRETHYDRLIKYLDDFFATEPPLPETGETLLRTLRAPILASPDSLEGQLELIQDRWQGLLPDELAGRLRVARGVLKEETRMRGLGPGPVEPLRFGAAADMGYPEYEGFSVDLDWMPNVVLLAKSTYVWLDQLAKKYARDIYRLDQVPDEELDLLAQWGFTALWLIGLWERSPASRKIKRMMGNPEAESSAYSLYDYTIANDLGGEEAYRQLAHRAWIRGIRLASDMVPNHVGIYSKWVVEHPDWFVQLDHPPFPSYQFTGESLSDDPRVGIQIEDGYWNHSDAAVVFRRTDQWTGDTRYIYHGNDGTSMPWNDTAQLDFTRAEVREAVLQTILHVARKFSIIRFDAAMTLAKKHYQRLWFPKPGDEGAIPSRAQFGMAKAEFDEVFPVEFWREVVDRVAQEVPDTLLLAEAFWLMEGYFVRTLGMHRVYNSAFMNMLKTEDNANYRQTIKNVLEFSPAILQRFVNFVNNPDEETAEAQFGKGDKYFGVAAMLATMPGLPMFGHGQVEGFTEKYGMEYRRAYHDEEVDDALVARHEREIFPLMRRRHLFSGAQHYHLFDFEHDAGHVDENVFVYSNRAGAERALLAYNNAYANTHGRVRRSTPVNTGTAEAPELVQRGLHEALALNTSETCYYIYTDYPSGLEYLVYARDIAGHGLPLHFSGYQYYALMDWREIQDFDRSWGKLHALLAGQGVPSVEEAYLEMHLSGIIEPFERMLTPDMVELLAEPPKTAQALRPFRQAAETFFEAVAEHLGQEVETDTVIMSIEDTLEQVREFPEWLAETDALYPEVRDVLENLLPKAAAVKEDRLRFWRVPVAWAVTRWLGAAAPPLEAGQPGTDAARIRATSGAWMREWFLVRRLAHNFRQMDEDTWRAGMDARLVRICVAFPEVLPALREEPWAPVLRRLLYDRDVAAFLMAHRFKGVMWIRREQLERMLQFLLFALALELQMNAEQTGERAAGALVLALEDVRTILDTAEAVGYDVEALLAAVK